MVVDELDLFKNKVYKIMIESNEFKWKRIEGRMIFFVFYFCCVFFFLFN